MENAVERPAMPPEIAKAILTVAKKVKQLGKDENNAFAKFKYVSVDKFYDAIGPMMAEAGLFVVIDETACDVATRETQTEQGQTKKSVWLTANYELTLFHESGVQYGPIHRMITVSATGPQAFGSGMSYVEKYFLRGLFKIPTGDEDADAAEQGGVPQVRGGKKAASAVDEKKVAMEKAFVDLREKLKTAKTEAELDGILKDSRVQEIFDYSQTAYEKLVAFDLNRRDELAGRKKLPGDHLVP